ncbi:MAG TPA: hypothetical protein VJQ54_12710 [Candidatus Sulfotelmatobacter sp.]|nr:hypothetical protein [Candidatus Sulfotelmatobacter sp.]
MSSRFSFVLLNLFAVLVASVLVPMARADQWNKETVVTFSNPVEVPGRVLPAGTYVFKLASSEADRQIVQIFTQDQRKLVATVLAVPDYRVQETDKPKISFEERPSGEPEALRSWFYPGDNYGAHFVYPKSTRNPEADVAANQEPPAIVAPESEAIPPMVSQLSTPPPLPVLAEQEPEQQVLAENIGPQPTQASLSVLPKTAGNYLVLPLLGLLFLGSGSVILSRMGRTASQASKS